MSSAEEQAREAVERRLSEPPIPLDHEIADIASRPWKQYLSEIIRVASVPPICPSDAAVIRLAREALGEWRTREALGEWRTISDV